jgi:cell division protein FtsN
MKFERGGFALGLIAGLLIGLALALGVALYITKAPVPFVNKVPPRTAAQDSAEAERNRNWDPNAPLANKTPAKPVADAGAAPVPAAVPVLPPPAASVPQAAPAAAPQAANKPAPRDPAAILAGGATPPGTVSEPPKSTAPALEAFVYFVQAGAYTRSEDAEQQRARLALMGQNAKITEREQAGRTVYRVRVGPFPSRDPADALQGKLQEQSIESQIVRVERP